MGICNFSCFIVVGQSTKDDYDIFSKTIAFGVASFDTDIEFYNFGDSRMKPFKIAVVIEKLEYEFKEDLKILDAFRTECEEYFASKDHQVFYNVGVGKHPSKPLLKPDILTIQE